MSGTQKEERPPSPQVVATPAAVQQPASAGRTNDWLSLAACIGLGLFLIALTRLPQLLGSRMALGSDECVLGVMAKHILEGKNLPVFFYGQRVGFSLVEAGLGAFFFLLFGIGAVQLKVAMLVLWALGWLFFVLATRKLAGTRAACVGAILLAVYPAWGVWSMKARGGYVTAFTFTSVVLWLLAGLYERRGARIGICTAIGFCLAVIYKSQPMWGLSLLPFLVVLPVRRRRILDALIVTVSGLCTTAVIVLLGHRQGPELWRTPLFEGVDPLLALELIPFRIRVYLTGAYWMKWEYPAGSFIGRSAAFWCVLLAAGCLLQSYRWLRDRQFSTGQASVLSILAVVAFTLVTNNYVFGFRYLLPIGIFVVILASMQIGSREPRWVRVDRFSTWQSVVPSVLVLNGLALAIGLWVFQFRYVFAMCGFAVILAALELSCFLDRRIKALPWTAVTVVVLSVAGTMSMVEIGRLSFSGSPPRCDASEAETMRALLDRLQALDIKHVYSTDPLFHWKIVFASQERVVGRSAIAAYDRCSGYADRVDRALISGQNVALVGQVPMVAWGPGLERIKRALEKAGYRDFNPQVINGLYFYVPNPSVQLIKLLGFKLKT